MNKYEWIIWNEIFETRMLAVEHVAKTHEVEVKKNENILKYMKKKSIRY